MDKNKSQNEYCAFILWGLGFKHGPEVISTIKNHPDFEVKKILFHPLTNIKRFVYDIYDFHPPQRAELRKKVRDLKWAKNPNVLIIFALNRNPQYKPVGTSKIPYLQCQTVYQLKEVIRKKFNPVGPDGKYTTDLIHSTDSEKEALHIAKTIGLNFKQIDWPDKLFGFVPAIINKKSRLIKDIRYYAGKIKEKIVK